MEKNIEYISIKKFMGTILTPQDPYYGDDNYISKILNEFENRNRDIYSILAKELNTKIIPKHTQASPNFSNYNTKQFIFLLTMIHSGLKLYSKNIVIDKIPTNEDIVINAVKFELSKYDIKKFLRSVKLPLPYFMFPEEADNTDLYVDHLSDVFDVVFCEQDFDKDIHDYE